MAAGKMREIILYVSEKLRNDPKFCATKLNKVLFFADFTAYRLRRESITEESYQKLNRGPAPKCLLSLRREMVESGELRVVSQDYFGKTQHRTIPLRSPKAELLTEWELQIVDMAIDLLRDRDAAECSHLSHDSFFWWNLLKEGDDIPYELALVDYPDDPSEEEIDYGQSLEGRAEEWWGTATR